MNIGITQNTLDPGGKKLLERAHQLKIDGIEPIIGTEESEYLAWTGREMGQYADTAGRLKVQIPSLAMSLFNGDPALIDSAGRKKAVDLTIRAINLCSAIGARTMLLCTYFASHPDTAGKKDNLLAVLKEVLPMAVEKKVRIGLESPLPAPELARLVDAATSDHLGVYYDVGNAIYHGYDPAGEIEQLGPRIMSIHIKDTEKMLGDSHLGKGRLNLPAVAKALKKINYNGWLMLETPHAEDAVLMEDLHKMKGLAQ